MVSRLPRAAALSRQLRMPRPGSAAAIRSQSTSQSPAQSGSSSSTPSTSSPSEPRALSTGSTSREPLLPESDRRPPILPFYPVPRPPNFPAQFVSPDGEPPEVKFLNYPYPLWKPKSEAERPKDIIGGDQREKNEKVLSAMTGLTPLELKNLRRVSIALQRVAHMAKKGRTRGYVAYQLVGDPSKGMVGLGRGAGDSMSAAIDKAFNQACKNMDYVDRYENRTVWGSGKELVGSFESTKVQLRARPPGFGLFVPHSVHRVLSICGIRDCSASIRGSTHLVNVTKCVIQMLHGGANPQGFGTGFGTRGKVENKGSGMRSKGEIERARGRYGVDIGRRV